MKALKPLYKRVLIKLSGEALLGDQPFGIHSPTLFRIAEELKELTTLGVETAVVIGGGNIFRGTRLTHNGIHQQTADHMGMLATVMNGLALQSALENIGVHGRLQSALEINKVCEPFVQRKAEHHLKKGRIVVLAAGTGHPYFTTDTAAVLRAKELGCDLLLKGTKVEGVYCSDPLKNPQAQRFDLLTHEEILSKGLRVMDMTAIALAKDQHLSMAVFSILEPRRMIDVICGQGICTFIQPRKEES